MLSFAPIAAETALTQYHYLQHYGEWKVEMFPYFTVHIYASIISYSRSPLRSQGIQGLRCQSKDEIVGWQPEIGAERQRAVPIWVINLSHIITLRYYVYCMPLYPHAPDWSCGVRWSALEYHAFLQNSIRAITPDANGVSSALVTETWNWVTPVTQLL